jgi:hypothetical protein
MLSPPTGLRAGPAPLTLDPSGREMKTRGPETEEGRMVRLAGPHLRDHTSRASFVFHFGPKADLAEEQLKAIQWFRHLGAKPVMKKNSVSLRLERVSQEVYERFVSILDKEGLPYTVE